MPIEPPETKYVTERVVACDGSDDNNGGLGHPRVYLNMGDGGQVECPYCDRLFILEDGAAKQAVGH